MGLTSAQTRTSITPVVLRAAKAPGSRPWLNSAVMVMQPHYIAPPLVSSSPPSSMRVEVETTGAHRASSFPILSLQPYGRGASPKSTTSDLSRIRTSQWEAGSLAAQSHSSEHPPTPTRHWASYLPVESAGSTRANGKWGMAPRLGAPLMPKAKA